MHDHMFAFHIILVQMMDLHMLDLNIGFNAKITPRVKLRGLESSIASKEEDIDGSLSRVLNQLVGLYRLHVKDT